VLSDCCQGKTPATTVILLPTVINTQSNTDGSRLLPGLNAFLGFPTFIVCAINRWPAIFDAPGKPVGMKKEVRKMNASLF
jgi:hypothetical protein